MKYIVYKSLDKSSSLLGLKGSYLYYTIGGLVVAAMIGVIVSRPTNGLVGMIVFIVLMVLVYLAVLRIQAKFSERERTKWFCSHRLPSFIFLPPKRMSSYAIARFSEKKVKPSDTNAQQSVKK